jgi:hypothetical protein
MEEFKAQKVLCHLAKEIGRFGSDHRLVKAGLVVGFSQVKNGRSLSRVIQISRSDL